MVSHYCLLSRKFILAGLLIMFGSSQAQPPSHTPKFSPYIDGNINGYWEYLPRNYALDAASKYPLIIFLHGAGEQGSDQSELTLNKLLRAGPAKVINEGNFPDSFLVAGQWHKFIVISPQIKNGIVNITSTIAPATIEAVIQFALSTYRIDPTRIYLCGLSMGGGGVWDYAGSSPAAATKLAAIVVATGAADLSQAQANKIAGANLPILTTHNRDDNIISVTRTEANISAIRSYTPAVSPDPKTLYWDLGGHNVWQRTFEDILPGTTPNGNLADSLGMNVYQWMLTNFRSSVALPALWVSFTVRSQNKKAVLQWIVNNQEDVTGYLLEKSSDGRQWTSVSSITGSGKISQAYNYIDAGPHIGVSFYRIRLIEQSGRLSYSAIKGFNPGAVSQFLVYPNPFTDHVRIDGDLPAGQCSIKLTDVNGKVLTVQKSATAGGELVIAGLSSLSTGNYFVTISDSAGELVFKTRLIKK